MLLEGIADLVYPPDIYCICCGGIINGEPYGLCQDCLQTIGWAAGRTCAACGKPLQDWYSQILCLDCGREEHFFRKGYCVACYDAKSKKIVHGLKYGGKGWLSKNIARMMSDRLRFEREGKAGYGLPDGPGLSDGYGLQDGSGQASFPKSAYDRIMPVPLHIKKRKKRGYNQAGLIAAELGGLIGVAVDQKTLVRSRWTQVMARLSAAERRQNLSEAFSLAGAPPKGERILLVDDVYTTGSTADSCARVLLSAGAKSVDVIVFAAGQNTFKNQSQAN